MSRLISGEDDLPYADLDIICKRQFTGREDKSGIGIYEGDLIKNKSGRIGTVIYNNGLACFDTECIGRSWRDTKSDGLMPADWSMCVTVIGNIYENPELL